MGGSNSSYASTIEWLRKLQKSKQKPRERETSAENDKVRAPGSSALSVHSAVQELSGLEADTGASRSLLDEHKQQRILRPIVWCGESCLLGTQGRADAALS